MARMKGGVMCNEPLIIQNITGLGWDLQKDGLQNIFNYLKVDLPKVSKQQLEDEKRDPWYTRQKYYEKHLLKLEKDMSWEKHNEFNVYINTVFQFLLGHCFEKVLAFSNFRIKRWDSTNVDISNCLNNTLIKLRQELKYKPNFEKPDPLKVREEAEKMRSTSNITVEEDDNSLLVNQLGRLICDTEGCVEMKVRVKSLKLVAKIKSKTETLIFHSISQFKELISTYQIELTKRQLLSLSAQLYDPSGTLIGYPIFLFKHIFHDLVTNNPNLNWDENLPEKYVGWVFKALAIFFLSLDYKLP